MRASDIGGEVDEMEEKEEGCGKRDVDTASGWVAMEEEEYEGRIQPDDHLRK